MLTVECFSGTYEKSFIYTRTQRNWMCQARRKASLACQRQRIQQSALVARPIFCQTNINLSMTTTIMIKRPNKCRRQPHFIHAHCAERQAAGLRLMAGKGRSRDRRQGECATEKTRRQKNGNKCLCSVDVVIGRSFPGHLFAFTHKTWLANKHRRYVNDLLFTINDTLNNARAIASHSTLSVSG